MKTLIVCHSFHHGNTRKVAGAIAEVLDARVVSPEEVTPELVAGYDLVGFGSGVYMGKVHHDITDLVAALPDMSGKRAFVFITSGSYCEEYVRPVHDLFKARGLVPLGAFECGGLDTYRFPGSDFCAGHPDADDLEHARDFARQIKRQLEKTSVGAEVHGD